MYGSQVLSDFDLSGVAAQFPSILPWGNRVFQTQLLNPTSDITEIRNRQLPLLFLKQNPVITEKWRSILSSLAKVVPAVDACCEPVDDLTNESVNQIFWSTSSHGAFLNTHSTVVGGLVFWKTLIVPFFAVILPLLTVILPFVLLQYIGRGISVNVYMSQIRRILVQQMSIPNFLRAKGDGDKLGYVLESVFVTLTLGAFASGIWTQISSALHLRSIWWLLEERGAAVLQTLSVARQLCDEMEAGGRAFRHLAAEGRTALSNAAASVGNDAISTFGTLLNHGTDGIRTICNWLGKVDVYVTLASGEYGPICVPRAIHDPSGTLRIQGVRHPVVRDCVVNNFSSTQPHVILTGPNRGGKSTYCKSVGLAVIFAQTWGFACASRMTWTPFRKIHSALETNGRLGFNSTFEAEIEFAKTVLTSTSNTVELPLLVMMDEIFHSTNAVDGVAASKVFLEQLYTTTRTVSLLSTHYRELVGTFKDIAAARQLDATEDSGSGVLTYSYKVIPGVSDKSSVMEILREKGLLTTPANCGTAVCKEPVV